MNRNLWLLAAAQGLFLTNNVAFIAINGLVGLALAPLGWMATLPVMGYVLGGAMSTSLVARTQARFGRKTSFQMGAAVALLSSLACAWAAVGRHFELLCLATVVAGYFNANAQLYRFAAAELAGRTGTEKAVSMVMAGGLIGAIAGPNLAAQTRTLTAVPFVGAYLALAGVALLSMLVLAAIDFPPPPAKKAAIGGRPLSEIVRQPVFIIAALCSSLGYGVMNLLMASTPIAMDQCGLPFSDTALVLETDAPDIPPHWLYTTAEQRAAGQSQGRNSSAELPRIAAELAQLRGISVDQLAQASSANARAALKGLPALPLA